MRISTTYVTYPTPKSWRNNTNISVNPHEIRELCAFAAYIKHFLHMATTRRMALWRMIVSMRELDSEIRKYQTKHIRADVDKNNSEPQWTHSTVGVDHSYAIRCKKNQREKERHDDLNFKYWRMEIVLRQPTQWHPISIHSIMHQRLFAFRLVGSIFHLISVFSLFERRYPFSISDDCLFQFRSCPLDGDQHPIYWAKQLGGLSKVQEPN